MNKMRTLMLTAALGLGAVGHAQAGLKWTEINAGPDPVTVTQTNAWSNTAGSGTANQQKIESAYLHDYGSSGLGVKNKDAGSGDSGENWQPEHAIDNDQRYDSVLVSFSAAVNLNALKLGYVSGDSDLTILAYTGDVSAFSLSGNRYQDLTGLGWSLVGHYADVGKSNPLNFTTDAVSSFWLIGAYNPLVGNKGVSSNGGILSKGNDHFKLAALSGTKPPKTTANPPPGGQVSEPASIALTGLALAGLMGLRRRKA